MAHDPISERFAKKQNEKKLTDLSKAARGKDDVAAEEELIKKTEKVPPIKGHEQVDRNAPCPCGSGKKYKKCCGAKA
ncbi:MAG: SEC-C domain-containing protein [Planctomycetaceae bacterium]|nr:SEC-C domain-containing protein [Planctomycetaceae bacterium]